MFRISLIVSTACLVGGCASIVGGHDQKTAAATDTKVATGFPPPFQRVGVPAMVEADPADGTWQP